MPKKKQEPKDDPVLTEAPTVTIAGHEYTLKRLGLRHVFKVARVLGNGVAVLGDQAGSLSPGQIVQVFVASMTRNEDEVLGLMADILGVTKNDLEDPERFPPDSIVDIFGALQEHQDLKAFLVRVQALTERLPEMQTASRAPSNS